MQAIYLDEVDEQRFSNRFLCRGEVMTKRQCLTIFAPARKLFWLKSEYLVRLCLDFGHACLFPSLVFHHSRHQNLQPAFSVSYRP